MFAHALYDVMHAGYQCRLRMHLHVASFFHMALPLLFHGYHADAVGAAMMGRLGGRHMGWAGS